MSFLTVDATNDNQAFCHDRCNIFFGLRYNKANDTFSIVLKKSDVDAQVKFTSKAIERARVTSTVIYFREKDWNTKGPGSTLAGLRSSFLERGPFSCNNRSKTLKCHKMVATIHEKEVFAGKRPDRRY